MAEQLLYDVDDAMRATRIGRTKLYELMADGTITSVKVGRRRMIPAQALRDFIDRLVAESDDRPADAV